jgi:HlyD family secretion protein
MKRAIRYAVALAVLAALGAAGYAGWRKSRVLEVEAVSPVRGRLTTFVEETGRVALEKQQAVCAPVAGMVGELEVDAGDGVEAGRVIARIEDIAVREGLNQARASIREIRARIAGLKAAVPREPELRQAALQVEREAKALEIERKTLETLDSERDQARRDLNRVEELSAQGVATTAEKERLETQLKTLEGAIANREALGAIAQLNLDAARQALALLEERKGDAAPLRQALEAGLDRSNSEIAVLDHELAKTVVTAPFAGIVLERLTRGLVPVAAGAPLVRIGDPATVRVEADLLSDDLPLVAEGRPCSVSGKALGGRTLTGRVAKIYPEAFTKVSSLGIEQQRVRVAIGLDAPPADLRPGISVDVKIEARKVEDALLVPERAVFSRKGAPCVLVVRDGRLAVAPFERGLSSDEFVQALSGLSASDEVVAQPENDMEEGREVRIARELKPEKPR